MKRPSQRRAEPLNVHRLAKGDELLLSDSDTLVLIVRGSCAVRSAEKPSQRVEAGALILRQSSGSRALDRRIASALGLLQAEPAKPWTVQRLARAVGLSRAAFARRFSDVTGCTPRRFLAELRLGLAASLLQSSDESLAEVALRVGYASEFAFSRAFKRKHGIAPGSFRREQQRTHFSPIRLAA